MKPEILPHFTHRMEINHQHAQENNTTVIGLGHMVLVFVMLSCCLLLSMLTLMCESLRWKVIQVGGLQDYLVSKIESYRYSGSGRNSNFGSVASGSDSLS